MVSKLPKGWRDVTVEKFIQLKSIEEKDFATHLSYRMEQLFIVTDTDADADIWDTTPTDELTEPIKKLEFLKGSPSINFKRKIKRLNYKESLTLGEFIDLEYLCGINYFQKLPDICAILYRKNRTNEWGHTVVEPRGYNETERADKFFDVSINDVYGVLQSYLNLKKKILDNYGEMLNEVDKEETEIEEIPSDELTAEDQAAANQEKLAAKWAWERVIHYYSQKSNLTFREVTNLPLIFFMNQLAMFHDLKI